MKKIFCTVVVCIFAGVILYGSGSMQTVKLNDITQGKIIGVGYMNINASYLSPMPVNYVVYPASMNEPFSYTQIRQHEDACTSYDVR